MELIIVLVVAAAVPTIVELRRDGLHRLTRQDDWRGLGSRHFG
ncbi:hypothetical protein ACX3O0_00735 [Homoserinimonas sp. A447]